MNDQNNLTIQGQVLQFRDQNDLLIGLTSAKVQIIAPTAGQTDFPVNGTYQVQKFQEYDYYQFQTSADDTFATLIENKIVKSTQLQSELTANTGYWIRVIAKQIATTENAITGVSITPSTATVVEGNALSINGTVQGTGTYNQTGSWSQVSGAIPFTVDGNTITFNPADGSAGAQSVFEFSAGGFTEQRTITVSEAVAQQDSRAGDEYALQQFFIAAGGETWEDEKVADIRDDNEQEILARGDATGWSATNMSLDSPIAGVTVASIGGELRVTEIDMMRVIYHGPNSDGTMIPAGNNLEGTLTPAIGNLKKCKYFNVKQNMLSGVIPDTIGDMTDLEWCSLAGQKYEIDLSPLGGNTHNHTKGLSYELGKWHQETNAFEGSIPSTIGQLKNLKVFECRSQYLSGDIPTEIGNCTSLEGLFIDRQKGSVKITGAVPATLVNTPIAHLHVEDNQIDEIPLELQSITTIHDFRASYNDVTSSPPTFSGANDLRKLFLNRNNLSGPFPFEMFNNGNNALLESIDYGFNDLFGEIGDVVGVQANPSTFQMSYNRLSGELKSWIADMGMIQFNVRNNELTSIGAKFYDHKASVYKEPRLYQLDANNIKATLPDVPFSLPDFEGNVTSKVDNSNIETDIPLGVVATGEITNVNVSDGWIQTVNGGHSTDWSGNHQCRIIVPDGEDIVWTALIYGSDYVHGGTSVDLTGVVGLTYELTPIVTDKLIRFEKADGLFIARNITANNASTGVITVDEPITDALDGLNAFIYDESSLFYCYFSENRIYGVIPQTYGYIPTGRDLRLWLHDNNLGWDENDNRIGEWIVPDFSKIGVSYNITIDNIYVDQNRLVPANLVPNHTANSGIGYRWTNQKPFTKDVNHNGTIGGSITFDLSNVELHPNDELEWRKNDGLLSSGGDISINGAVLTINNLSNEDEANYKLIITNPALGSEEFESGTQNLLIT